MISEAALYDAIWGRSELLFTEEEFAKLKNAVVGIAGVGGVGCIATEMLARIGIGHFRLADPDCFDHTNLNRQLFATMSTIGRPKVDVGKERVLDINPYCHVETFAEGITPSTVTPFMTGLTVAVGVTDVMGPAVLLHRVAKQLRVPVVKGSRAGYPGHRWQVKGFAWDYRQEPPPPTPEETNKLSTLALPLEELTVAVLKGIDEEILTRMRERLGACVSAGDASLFRPKGAADGAYMRKFVGSPDNIRRTICSPIANAGGVLAAVEAIKMILGWPAAEVPVDLLA